MLHVYCLKCGDTVSAVCYCGQLAAVIAGHSSQKAWVAVPRHHHFAWWTRFMTAFCATAGMLWTTLLMVPISHPVIIHLFGLLKKHLAGKKLTTDTNIKQNVISWLQTLNTSCFCPVILTNVNSDYMEVWWVPSATHGLHTHWSQNSTLRLKSMSYFFKLPCNFTSEIRFLHLIHAATITISMQVHLNEWLPGLLKTMLKQIWGPTYV